MYLVYSKGLIWEYLRIKTIQQFNYRITALSTKSKVIQIGINEDFMVTNTLKEAKEICERNEWLIEEQGKEIDYQLATSFI